MDDKTYVTKDCCPGGCKGIDIGDGSHSGCACKGDGSPCDCPNHEVVRMQDVAELLEAKGLKVLAVDEAKDVVEHLESIARSEREERPLTADEARAQVCRSVAAMLTKSIADTEAELAKAKEAGQDGVQEETGRRIVAAARELGVQLITTARKLDRPRILRPDRRLKVVRPH